MFAVLISRRIPSSRPRPEGGEPPGDSLRIEVLD